MKGSVALLSAKIGVRATAPGIFGNAILNHAVDRKGRMGMDRRPRRFCASALIDGDIDIDSTEPCFIIFFIVLVMSFDAEAPRTPRR